MTFLCVCKYCITLCYVCLRSTGRVLCVLLFVCDCLLLFLSSYFFVLWAKLPEINLNEWMNELRCAVTLNFDPVILTFDLSPWTFVVSRLCRSQTLYEIWAQLGNQRRSYCSLNFDLMNLNMYHVLPLCSGIVCTKFKLSPAIRLWNVTTFSCWYVTSRYDLDLWPLDLEHLW